MTPGSRLENIVVVCIVTATVGIFLWGTAMFGLHYNEIRDRVQARERQECVCPR